MREREVIDDQRQLFHHMEDICAGLPYPESGHLDLLLLNPIKAGTENLID